MRAITFGAIDAAEALAVLAQAPAVHVASADGSWAGDIRELTVRVRREMLETTTFGDVAPTHEAGLRCVEIVIRSLHTGIGPALGVPLQFDHVRGGQRFHGEVIVIDWQLHAVPYSPTEMEIYAVATGPFEVSPVDGAKDTSPTSPGS